MREGWVHHGSSWNPTGPPVTHHAHRLSLGEKQCSKDHTGTNAGHVFLQAIIVPVGDVYNCP